MRSAVPSLLFQSLRRSTATTATTPVVSASALLCQQQLLATTSEASQKEKLAERRRNKAPRKIESEDTAMGRQAQQAAAQQAQMGKKFARENVRPVHSHQEEMMSKRAAAAAAAAAANGGDASTAGSASSSSSSSSSSTTATGAVPQHVPEPPPRKGRSIRVFSNTAKGLYIHFPNYHGMLEWIRNDLPYWFWGCCIFFVGSQVYVRWKVAKRETAEQAKLGETLLDNRTRDLLGDIENLRNKDPLRLESEANLYHQQYWSQRANAVADARKDRREMEIQRGQMQGAARGTDMTEWLGAKHKDEEEREVARRTQDYIQGFHMFLKSRTLI